MIVGVLSDCRLPTVPAGGHGLGRMAWDMAEGLRRRGIDVLLFAGPGSSAPDGVPLICHRDESKRPGDLVETWDSVDVWMDLSHRHDLSRLHPEIPVVNWIVDLECDWTPPNAIVGNEWQRGKFPAARIVPLGIDLDKIPFYPTGGRHLVFAHKIHPAKGVDIAVTVGQMSGRLVRFAGQRFMEINMPEYVGEIHGDDALYQFLGGAAGLLSPTREDAGGRVNLESAATGTPVLTFDWTGTQCHVGHCVSGFVCADLDEMVEAVNDLKLLDRSACREWVADRHGMDRMIDGVNDALMVAREGVRW